MLVAGGAGAVGNAAIQLARWAGRDGDHHGQQRREGGAGHRGRRAPRRELPRAATPTKEILALAPDGVDIVVEVAPAQNNALDLAVVEGPRARSRSTPTTAATRSPSPCGRRSRRNLRYQFLLLYTLGEDLVRAAAEDVTAAVAAGALRVGEDAGVPLHHYPLEETAAAHDAVEGGAVGKVLIDVASVVEPDDRTSASRGSVERMAKPLWVVAGVVVALLGLLWTLQGDRRHRGQLDERHDDVVDHRADRPAGARARRASASAVGA